MHQNDTRLPNQRIIVGAYVGWLASCLIFFALGICIGRLIPSSASKQPGIRESKLAETVSTLESVRPGLTAGAQYAVQVAVVTTADEANRIAQSLSRRGFTSAYITRPSLDAAQPVYKVSVGFYNLPTASQVAEELRQDLGFRSAQVILN